MPCRWGGGWFGEEHDDYRGVGWLQWLSGHQCRAANLSELREPLVLRCWTCCGGDAGIPTAESLRSLAHPLLPAAAPGLELRSLIFEP
jgi:hypothetical protein